MENQDKKRILIIETALKRFAHYGLSKTTMTEIAKDISFSKALLYYYFPDKLSLYVSVIEHLMHTISRDLIKSIEKSASCRDAILLILQKRQTYIQKYYNLLASKLVLGPDLPPDLHNKFMKAKDFEIKTITSLFSKGVDNGELFIEDIDATTEIFLEALAGIHFNILNKDKTVYPDKEQFKQIFVKEKKFAEIFLLGLTCKPTA